MASNSEREYLTLTKVEKNRVLAELKAVLEGRNSGQNTTTPAPPKQA